MLWLPRKLSNVIKIFKLFGVSTKLKSNIKEITCVFSAKFDAIIRIAFIWIELGDTDFVRRRVVGSACSGVRRTIVWPRCIVLFRNRRGRLPLPGDGRDLKLPNQRPESSRRLQNWFHPLFWVDLRYHRRTVCWRFVSVAILYWFWPPTINSVSL